MWQMPLADEYAEMTKSKIAGPRPDITHSPLVTRCD